MLDRPRSSRPARRASTGSRVLIADHQFPAPDGPLDPAVAPAGCGRRGRCARRSSRCWSGALTKPSRGSPLPAVLVHPLSILPKLGLRGVAGPRRVRCARWRRVAARRAPRSRSTRSGRARDAATWRACSMTTGVGLVAGSDAHDASALAVGRYDADPRATPGGRAGGERPHEPDSRRRWSREPVTLFLVVVVLLGALAPLVGALRQYLLIGLHAIRNHLRRTGAYLPRTVVVIPAWNEAAVIGAIHRPAAGHGLPGRPAADRRGRRLPAPTAHPTSVLDRAARHPGRVSTSAPPSGGGARPTP